jgi:Tenascin EGF domain
MTDNIGSGRKIYEAGMQFKGQRCYTAECILKTRSIQDFGNINQNKSQYTIRINVGNQSIECLNSFEWLKFPKNANDEGNYGGSLYCPDIEKFCKIFPPECPNGCNGNGVCQEGKCICNDFYEGESCINQGGIYRETSDLID